MNVFLGYPPENIKQWIKDHYNTGPDLSIPLCFEAVEAGATIALNCKGNNLKTATFQTSTDGNTWTDYTYTTSITLANAGDKVYFKAKADNTSIERNFSNYLQFTTTQDEKKVNVSGNVMSLLAPEFDQLRVVGSYCFYKLFYGCKNIVGSSNLTLSATQLANGCYSNMFDGCTSLTSAPELPVTTLDGTCYYGMFQNCTSLTQAPELPATTLANGCYSCMFHNCTSLTQAPELPATVLFYQCYANMFQNCTSLTQAPELPATTLANQCYEYMFHNCTSLTQAPELPATTLDEYCYEYMFQNCTSLTTAPELPATTLAYYCYNSMFEGCTSLTQCPAIKTYTPDLYAFNYMFAMFDWNTYTWGQLTSCNWPDLTLDEAETIVLDEYIFGYGDETLDVSISITCKDGTATVYFDPCDLTWVFEY